MGVFKGQRATKTRSVCCRKVHALGQQQDKVDCTQDFINRLQVEELKGVESQSMGCQSEQLMGSNRGMGCPGRATVQLSRPREGW